MTEICITPAEFPSSLIWPDVSSLIQPFTDMYSIPSPVRSNLAPFPEVPTMPTVPQINGQFPTISMPSLEGVMTAGGVQAGQVFILVDYLIGGLTNFIPAIPLPDMPGLPFSLSDLLSFNPTQLLEEIRLPGFDYSSIPNLPTLWPTSNIPEISSLQALQYSGVGMMELLTGSLLSLIASFLSYLDILELGYPILPVLPTIPTIEELAALLPPSPTIGDIPSLIVPGFPSLPFPDPLRPDGVFPNFDITTGVQCIYQDMNMFVIKTLSDYIESLPLVGPLLTGGFPTVGDLVGPFSVGEICYNA